MSSRNTSDGEPPSRGWYAVIIGGAIVCSAGIAFFVRGGMSDIQRLRERKEYLEKRNSALRKKSRQLELRRQRLHQDPHLIEDLARDRLGLVQPGERRVEFEETDSDTRSSDTTSRSDTGTTRSPSSDSSNRLDAGSGGDLEEPLSN
jgi:cell division protein FtsB